MLPEGLQVLPLFNDRDNVSIETLSRQSGINIHSREIFETPLFRQCQNVRPDLIPHTPVVIEPFLLGTGVPGEGRGIIEPVTNHLRSAQVYRTPFVGVTANRHDILIFGVPEVLQRLTALLLNIYADLAHDGNGMRIQPPGLVSRRTRFEEISPQKAGKPFRHLASAGVSRAEKQYSDLLGHLQSTGVGIESVPCFVTARGRLSPAP